MSEWGGGDKTGLLKEDQGQGNCGSLCLNRGPEFCKENFFLGFFKPGIKMCEYFIVQDTFLLFNEHDWLARPNSNLSFTKSNYYGSILLSNFM